MQTATKTMGEHIRDPWKKLSEDKVFGIAPQGVHKASGTEWDRFLGCFGGSMRCLVWTCETDYVDLFNMERPNLAYNMETEDPIRFAVSYPHFVRLMSQFRLVHIPLFVS